MRKCDCGGNLLYSKNLIGCTKCNAFRAISGLDKSYLPVIKIERARRASLQRAKERIT